MKLYRLTILNKKNKILNN